MATKEELEQQLVKTREDMKILAGMAAERAETAGTEMVGTARDQAAMLSEEAQALVSEATAEGKRMAKEAGETMSAHPFATAGIAFGVGMLLGAVLRR